MLTEAEKLSVCHLLGIGITSFLLNTSEKFFEEYFLKTTTF